MTAGVSRFYFNNSDGELCKIVHPSANIEIQDGRHDEAGKTGVNLLRALYDACNGDVRAEFVLLQPFIGQIKPLIGDLMVQRVALIDALIQFRADKDTYDTRVAQWPTPTGPQQLLINAALAKVSQDLQDIQTIRDNIAAIKAQLS